MALETSEIEEGRGLLAPVTVNLDTGGRGRSSSPRTAPLARRTPSSERPELAEAGLVAPSWPEPWGRNASVEYQLIIDDELRRARVQRPINPIGIGWAGPTIVMAGTPKQQQHWLPKLLSGEEFWCQLFSEPGAGSDLAALSTTARRDGDEWIVTGQKSGRATPTSRRGAFSSLERPTKARPSRASAISSVR